MFNKAAKSLSIHATLDRIHVTGDMNQDVHLAAGVLWRSLPARPTDRGLDLLNIAAGVYAVDRIVKREPGAGNETGIRSLKLCFAVQDLAFWQRLAITEALEELLSFLTDENWSLTFEQAAASAPQQALLDLHLTPRRIALYSGGLDSAAGLANRLIAGVDDYLLVTVGHHTKLRRLCARQVQELSQDLSRITATVPPLHLNLIVHLKGGAAKNRLSQQECTQRSRAFLFCAAAAVAAQTCRIEHIEMFENGVGAINLPVMTGMLIGGLATRGAHPSFLKRMGELASAVAEHPVRYSLPFAAFTKAEMLVLLKAHGLETWAQSSQSCVHTSLRQRKATHCGQCPGCIERRQAFAAAGIAELPGQYSFDLFTGAKLAPRSADYLHCYLGAAAAWLSDDAAIRRRLDWHLSGTRIPSGQRAAIAEHQYRHAQEVMATLGRLSKVRFDNFSYPIQ